MAGRMRRIISPHHGWLLIAILLLGAVLRIIGLFHGVHFHPDERSNIMHVMKLSFNDMNPHFFAYGSFPLYLLFFVKTLLGFFSKSLTSYDSLFLVGRVISAFLGIATIGTTYLIGTRMYNRQIGNLGALFLALAVLHIQYSHFYAVDILLTFMVSLIFLLLIGIFKVGETRNYIVTGLFFGVGLATKISIMPLLLTVVLAHLFRLIKAGNFRYFRAHYSLLVFFVVLAISFTLCQPYTFLDYEKFFHDVREQANMVSGKWQPPYTIQYEKTLAYVYPVVQMMKWSLGYPLVMAAILGLGLSILSVRRKWLSLETILLTWIIPYFIITGSFKAKFLRYMLPIFPFVCILAARFFDYLLRERAFFWRRVAGRVILSATIVYLICYSFAFITIYTRPHPYISASEWIYKHITPAETILVEHWDDTLPVSIPGSHRKPKIIVLPMYEKDRPGKVTTICEALEKGDYIVQATKRLYGSIGKVPERYPDSARYYQLLLNGKLGFQLVKTIQSYPSLLGYELVDDLADESFTVYDHPKVCIFKKVVALPLAELQNVLETPLSPTETVPLNDILQARTFGDEVYHPFDVDQSLQSTLLYYCFIELLSFFTLPFALALCRHKFALAYPLSKFFITVIPVYILWILTSAGIVAADDGSILLSVLLFLFLSYILADKKPNLWEQIQANRSLLLWWEILFGAAFFSFLLIRAFNPEIFWGEKPMDFSFLNTCYRTTGFPLQDPWFCGKNINYYFFGYLQAAFYGRLLNIPPAILYNLHMALVPALAFILCVAALYSLLSKKFLAFWGGFFIIFGSNLSALYQSLLTGRKISFGLWWDTSRVLPSPAIDEYPVWSFLFADLHAHVLSLPVALAIILFTIMLLKALSKQDGPSSLIHSLTLSFLLGIIAITNSWDFLTYVAFLAIGLLFSTIVDLRRFVHEDSFKSRLTIVSLPVLRFLYCLAIILFSFVWVIFHYQTYSGIGMKIGFVKSDFATLDSVLLHFGQFMILIILVIIYSSWKKLSERNNSDQAAGTHKFWRQVLLREGTVFIVLMTLYGFLRFSNLEAFGLGLMIALVASVFALSFKRGFALQIAGFAITVGGLIIVGAETYYVIDRMNTIFKFYYPAWLFLGLGCWVLTSSFMTQKEEVDLTTGRSETSASVIPAVPSLRHHYIFNLGASIVIIALLYGTAVGIATVVSVQRVSSLRPTLDGRKYMLLSAPGDYAATRWLNENIHGTPVIAEAHGPPYQTYTRVSMHTGLPTVVGWEHHTYQRGASRQDIRERKGDLNSLYTSSQEKVVADILAKYGLSFVYFGDLERRTYLPEDDEKLSHFIDLLRPVYTEGKTVIYQVVSASDQILAEPSITPRFGDRGLKHTAPELMNDWDMQQIFSVPGQFAAQAQFYGLAVDDENIYLSDAGNNKVFKLSGGGRFKGFLELQTALHYPTSLMIDESGKLWISDTGNNRIVGVFPTADEADNQLEIIAQGFDRPAGLTNSPDGNFYIADFGNDRIIKYVRAQQKIITISETIEKPLGIHYLPAGYLAVYSAESQKITILDLNREEAIPFSVGERLVFSTPEGYIGGYESDVFSFSNPETGNVMLFNTKGELIRHINCSMQNPRGIALSGDKCILICDSGANKVFSICPKAAKSMFAGGLGSQPGQFIEPRALAQDSQGNFYVVDTRNYRIQKFNSEGSYILQWGEQGQEYGQFNDPMGIAIDDEDIVYIADTWNQRIQVFDHLGHYLTQWEDHFYGPREIFHHDGQIYVADTGNHEIKVYDRSGRKIRSFGRKGSQKGELKEPIGIAVYNDNLYVADSANSRIQVFDDRGQWLQSIPVKAWGQPGQREHYLTVTPDGLIVTADTVGDKILFYDQNGKLVKILSQSRGQSFNKPRDIFYSRLDHHLYVVDTWNHSIKKVAVPKDLK
ncbi:DUF2298 domain-containing protein [candidate division CSSED10-310 bacterium]|uniref:DUF2298 domain-containing protein n=1 Tax=candidate division CSSED10-310 bacterium TaxID=2855610 RepID=A0ABV6YXV9_UNCC1